MILKTLPIVAVSVLTLSGSSAVFAQQVSPFWLQGSITHEFDDGRDIADRTEGRLSFGTVLGLTEVYADYDINRIDEPSGSLNMSSLQLGASLRLNGFGFDGSWSDLRFGELEDGSMGEIGLTYYRGPFSGRLSYANFDSEFLDADDARGLELGWAFSDRTSVQVGGHRFEESNGGAYEFYTLSLLHSGKNYDLSALYLRAGEGLDLVLADASWQFRDQLALIGEIHYVGETGDFNAWSAGIGVEYQFSDRATFEAMIRHYDYLDITGTRVSLGVSYDIGNRKTGHRQGIRNSVIAPFYFEGDLLSIGL